jgi:hypothetical protein
LRRDRPRLRPTAPDADRLAHTYVERTRPDAILLGGSAVTGGADEHSDVDLLLYYAELPADGTIAATRDELGGSDLKVIAPRTEAGTIEQFVVDGVTCQIGHLAFADIESDIRRIAVDADADPYVMKAIGGLHEGLALHGSELIQRWRSEAAYGDELQRAEIAKHWKVFPLWRLHDHIEARDALIWRQQILVDAAFDLLAVLAAVNRVWFSSFQFKRTRRLVDRLEVAPPRLADRLESLFAVDARAAADELERLAGETEAILSARGLLP